MRHLPRRIHSLFRKEASVFEASNVMYLDRCSQCVRDLIGLLTVSRKLSKRQKSAESSERIVATTVAAAEIMDALEVDLVGVPTSQKSLPARYKGLPEVGNPMSPDMEIIQSLQPTDVLSVTTLQYDLETPFQQAGVPATYLNLESMSSMEKAITKLGDQYDRKKQAERIVSEFEQKRKTFKRGRKENASRPF